MPTKIEALEAELMELIRKLKTAINSHQTEEYEILTIRMRNKMTEYFLEEEIKESFK